MKPDFESPPGYQQHSLIAAKENEELRERLNRLEGQFETILKTGSWPMWLGDLKMPF